MNPSRSLPSPVGNYKNVLDTPLHFRRIFFGPTNLQIAQVDFYYSSEGDLIPNKIVVHFPTEGKDFREFEGFYDYLIFVRELYSSNGNAENGIITRIVNFFKGLFGR